MTGKNMFKAMAETEVRVGGFDELRGKIKEIIATPKSIDKIPKNGVVYVSPENLPKLLSKERLKLIHEIRKKEQNIGQLASSLHRQREHISRDINLLERYGLVQTEKRGRQVYTATTTELRITV
jgi:predicted transcriptional regulator